MAPQALAVAVLGLLLALSALPSAMSQEGGPLLLSGRAWANTGAMSSWTEGAAAEDASLDYAAETGLRFAVVNADRSVMRFDAMAEASLLSGAAAEPALAAMETLSGALVSALGIPPGVLLPLAEGSAESFLSLSLKKFSLRYDADFLAISVGRQIVNFGKGLLFSPVDIFSPPSLSGVEAGRNGTDSLRLSLPLGNLAMADAVARPGRAAEDGDYGLRAAASLGILDIALSGAYRGRPGEWLAGAEAQTGFAIGALSLTLYGETALTIPADGPGADGRWRATAGLSIVPLQELMIRGEYYFNGKSPEYGYASSGAQDHLLAYPLPHYAFLMASWAPSDFWSIALTCLQGFSETAADPPGLAAFRWTYSGYPGTSIGAQAGAAWGGPIGLRASLGLSTELRF